MESVEAEGEYDGCGRCFLGLVRLSRKSDKTNSPAEQRRKVLAVVESVGGHVIAWAEDLEVSGATDPLTRPALGPWLRGERGSYDGLAGAAVDRIGRNQLDVLNTADRNHKARRLLVTYGHDGPWNLDDPVDEMRLSMEAFGAQIELRSIQRRNRDEAVRARSAGQVKNMNAYGYVFVRKGPNLPIDHVAIDPTAAKVIREVARRILADATGMITCETEAARLSRARVLSPADHRRVMYGKEPKGCPWSAGAIRSMLRSEAALGYRMHNRRPVLGEDGHPVRIAEPLWDRATHEALIEKTKTKPRKPARARKGTVLLSGCGDCGTCGRGIEVAATGRYGCNGRVKHIQKSQHCKPAPTISMKALDAQVTAWFLDRYGSGEVMERAWDPGTGYAAQIKELEADRNRIKSDRNAGLYDTPAEEEWYRREYRRMTKEIARLADLPERPGAMRLKPTGQTVAQKWHSAPDNAVRREMLFEFEVRFTLYPATVSPRVRISGLALPVLAA